MVDKILELIPPTVASLAWPVTAIVIVCLVRRQLQELISRLEKAERRFGSLIFPNAIADIKADLVTVEGVPTPDPSLEETEKPEAKDLYAPVAEVMSAWADVEKLCQQLLAKNGHHVSGAYRDLGSRLERNRLIDHGHAAILDKLRQVRNIAVHGGPGTVGAREAQEYSMLASHMTAYLYRQLTVE